MTAKNIEIIRMQGALTAVHNEVIELLDIAKISIDRDPMDKVIGYLRDAEAMVGQYYADKQAMKELES
jgi:hypothetical protein